jgi:methyl-accepting chemotaxis protein III, ribose and galactose sensor receptor
MNIRHRAMAILGGLTVLFVVGAASSTWFLLRSNESLSKVREEVHVLLSMIDPINHSRTMRVRLAESMADRNAGRVDDAQSALSSAQVALGKSEQAFQTYMHRPKTNDEASLSNAFRVAYQNYHDEALLPMIRAASIGDQEQFQLLVRTVAPTLDHQFEVALGPLLEFHERYAESLNEQAQAHFRLSLFMLAMLTVVAVVTQTVTFVWLRRNLLFSLDQASQHCTQIAKGNLRTRVASQSNNEIGVMMQSLEEMRRALASTIETVRGASDAVAHGSSEIAYGNVELSMRTEQQAASLEETSASMGHLTQATLRNAENAKQATLVASNATSVANRSSDVVQSMVTTVAEIGRSSEKVSDITGVIESIAFQTNILALNAAVEAARAGEQGRGFAVVASEVRSLAQRSAVAAKEIKELIGSSVAMIQDGAKQASDVGAAMGDLKLAIKQVSDIVGEIAAASEEQSKGIEQVHQAVAQMDEVTQHNAALVEQVAAASQSLEEQASNLRGVVSVFQLTDAPLLASGATP